MKRISQHRDRETIVVGVDTHKYILVAVALSMLGERLGDITVPADPGGYEQLLRWARLFGKPARFGVEGCGSYGQGLVRFLRRNELVVLEAGRPDRRDRRNRGKSQLALRRERGRPRRPGRHEHRDAEDRGRHQRDDP